MAVNDYGKYRLSQHAIRRAVERLKMPRKEAIRYLREKLKTAREITAKECAHYIGTPAIIHDYFSKKARKKWNTQHKFLLLDENPPVVAIISPRDRIVVTILVRGHMLPLELKMATLHPKQRLLWEFAMAAERFGSDETSSCTA